MDLTFLLNGESVTLRGADPTQSVLDWLRESAGLKGTKEGCNEGDCGACTVMLTARGVTHPVNACLMMLGHLDGKALTTVEGLEGPEGEPHPVAEEMVRHHGSQCGFCTPGFVVSLAAGHLYGERNHDDQLAGNLCRCTGYAPIVRAAQAAQRRQVPDWFRERLAMTPPAPLGDAARPTSMAALAQALEARPGAVLINGATDVGLWLTKGLRELDDVIFLDGVPELRLTAETDEAIRIGAGVSIETLRGLMADQHPAFAEMLRRFASAQIRAVGTVGGNIGNGSPIADTPPVLIALGAELALRKGEARRTLPLEDYYIAYGQQDRAPGEVIEWVSIPRQSDALHVYKLSRRADQDISAVLGAFNIAVEDGVVSRARIAFGGMAATPRRAPAAEAALLGQPWAEATVEAAAQALASDYQPISDHRASAGYRMQAAQNMLRRLWHERQGATVSVHEVTP